VLGEPEPPEPEPSEPEPEPRPEASEPTEPEDAAAEPSAPPTSHDDLLGPDRDATLLAVLPPSHRYVIVCLTAWATLSTPRLAGS
jgi:hypothetical protein